MEKTLQGVFMCGLHACRGSLMMSRKHRQRCLGGGIAAVPLLDDDGSPYRTVQLVGTYELSRC